MRAVDAAWVAAVDADAKTTLLGQKKNWLCSFAQPIFLDLFLLGAVDTVARVAQTGDDVAVLVQVIVLGAQIDVHIGFLI